MAAVETRAPVSRSAGRREWIGLAVLALPTLLLALDMSVLYLALPHLSADLGASSIQSLWITDIYGFLIAGFLVTMGTLGDRIGRRRLLVIGAAAFGVASVLAAYSTSAEMLIATRALLGIAGATLMPSTLALISNMFADPRQRAVAIGVWMSCFMVGMTIGPLVGGVLLEVFWWGSVFLLGVPVMVLLLLAAPALLPEYRDPLAGRLDLTSVALSLAAVLPAVYGLKELAKDGLGSAPILTVLLGMGFGSVFVRRQRRLADPLLDLRLFDDRAFGITLGVMLLGGAVMGGTFLLVTIHLQMVEGLSPLRAALWLLPQNLTMIVATMLVPLLARRFRPGSVMAAGLGIAAAGLLLLTRVDSSGGVAVLVTGFCLAAVGIGPLGVLCTDLIVGSAPPEKAGSASSMSETSAEFGIAVGVAALGSISTAVYRSQIAVSAEVPAAAATAAREGITGAVATADQLPGSIGAVLLDSAREAFTTGLHVGAGAGAALFIGLAVLTAAALRHVPPYGKPLQEPADDTHGGEVLDLVDEASQPASTR